MKRAALLLLTAGCFNLDADYAAYCFRTGNCDAGVSSGGGTGQGGGGANAGGGTGGSMAGGGTGGSSVGGGTGGSGGSGGASTDGGCSSPGQCTSPFNGTATCDLGACGFNCNTGYHRCTFSCANDYDPNQCGATCMSCPNPMNGLGTRACDAGVCDFTCINGYRRCADNCVAFASPTACGPSCGACNVPTGGQAFCDAGTTCDFNCQSGFTKMNGRCLAPPNITFPNIADIADPATYLDVRIDPVAPSTTLWAVDFSGQVLVSQTLGQSFAPVCRMPNTGLDPTWSGFGNRSDTRMLLSPGPDRTAYVTTASSRVLRADVDGGAVCRDVTPPPGYYFGGNTYSGASATVALDGTLYLYDSYNFGGEVRRSGDRGATWQLAVDAGVLTATYTPGTMSAGPDGDVLLTVNSGTGGGLFLITDGGTVITRVSATIYGSDMMPRWSPAHPGYAYAGRGSATLEGFYTMNGGRNWTQSAPHAVAGDWAVDPVSGAGYRYVFYDGGLNLERAPDMRTPVWARTVGFWPGVSGPYDRVDAIGTTVTALVGNRLYVSQDQAQSFTRIGSKPPLLGGTATLASDGTRVLLADNRANVFESTDQGHVYALKYSPPSFPAVSSGWLEMNIHPTSSLNAIVRPVNVFISSGLVTHDAFSNGAVVNLNATPYYSTFAWAPTAASQAYLYGNSSSYAASTVNGGDAWTSLTLSPGLGTFSTTWSSVVTDDPTFGLAAECAGASARMFRINNSTKTTTDIGATVSNVLGNDFPCGLEVFPSGVAGQYRVRVISRTGWLAVSDDDGLSFSAVSGAAGGLNSCSARRLTSLSSDRNVVVSWCHTQNQLAVSRNGGTSWTNIAAGLNWANYGCNVTSLHPLATQLLVTCVDRPPLIVDY